MRRSRIAFFCHSGLLFSIRHSRRLLAGIYLRLGFAWIPAFAGMTEARMDSRLRGYDGSGFLVFLFAEQHIVCRDFDFLAIDHLINMGFEEANLRRREAGSIRGKA